LLDPLDRSVTSHITKQFVILDENVSVANAVSEMHSKKVETIIVQTKDKKEFGVVTDSDILDKVVIKGIDSDEIFLKDVMSHPAVTLSTKATVKGALEIMRIKKIKRVLILNQDNPDEIMGILTQSTLANAIRTSVLERTFRPYRVLVREHYKPIAGNLGFLMQFAGVLMIAPALVATFLGENKSATGIYLAVVATSITGFILNTLGEKSPLNLKQSSIVVVSGFILLSIFGSLPYMYINPFWKGIDTITLFVNSFFESSSGFTTTGISTIAHPEDLPQSFSFYRSYTLWVGGLSFVYLVMSLYYPEKKLSAMRNILGAGILKFRQLVSTISIIFVFYAIILILLIYFLGINSSSIIGISVNTNGINNNDQIKMIIDSVSIIFATLTSGGFVPVSTFLTLENVGQLMVIMAGMIIAALPFAFHYGIFSRAIKARELASEIAVYMIFISLSILLFTSIEYQYLNSIISSNTETLSKDLSHPIEKGPQLIWIISAFHVISAATTTGFQFIDLSNLSVEGKIELIIIMLIGGTAFSTAGGIKIARLILIFKILKKKKPTSLKDILRSTSTSISSTPSQFANIDKSNREYKKDNYNMQKTSSSVIDITKSSSPSSLNYLKPPSISITNKPLREALLVIFLFVSVSIVSAFAIGFLANRNFIDALFESSSAISNTGLSVGITTMNLDDISKSILSLEMILGRFEIIAILYVFMDRLRR
jgi:trk system potassium uptake protein